MPCAACARLCHVSHPSTHRLLPPQYVERTVACSSLPALVRPATMPGTGSTVYVYEQGVAVPGSTASAFQGQSAAADGGKAHAPPVPAQGAETAHSPQLFYYYDDEDDVIDSQDASRLASSLTVALGAASLGPLASAAAAVESALPAALAASVNATLAGAAAGPSEDGGDAAPPLMALLESLRGGGLINIFAQRMADQDGSAGDAPPAPQGEARMITLDTAQQPPTPAWLSTRPGADDAGVYSRCAGAALRH